MYFYEIWDYKNSERRNRCTKSKKNKTAKINYFFSYLVIVFVLVLISTVSYINAAGMMKSASLLENEGYLKSVKYEMDEMFRKNLAVAVEVSFNQEIKDFCKVGAESFTQDQYYLYSAIQAFKAYENKLPENSVFYSGKSATILTFNGAVGLSEYLMAMYKYEDMVNISACLKSDDIYEFYETETLEGDRHLLFIYDIGIAKYDNRAGKVIMPIPVKNMEKQFKKIENFNKNGKCYMNAGGHVINPMECKQFDIARFAEKKELRIEEYGKNVVGVIKSGVIDAQYVSVIPKADIYGNTNRMNLLIVINIVLMLLLGILLTLLLVRQNMKPLKKLMTVLEDMGIKSDNVNNEFDFIQNVVSVTVKEKEEIGEIVDKQNKTLKSYFIRGMISGRFDEKISVNDMFRKFDIKPISNRFAVGLFYVKNPEVLFKEEKSLDSDERRRLTSLIMGNILEELVGEHHLAFVVEIKDMQVCLVNVNKSREDKFYEDMENAIENARENINKYFSIDFAAAFGSIYSSVKYISKSYDEAVETMNYKTIVGMDGIFKYADISGYDDESYVFSGETEKEFISAIRCGKSEKALSLLDEAVDLNLYSKKLPGHEITALMISITSGILKAVDNADEKMRQKYFAGVNEILKMIGTEKISDIKEKMTQVVMMLCAEQEREIKMKKGSLGEKACNFISENYFDTEINAGAVAEKLGVHAAYLSKIFKQQVGMGVLDYLNKVRIEKAKEILAGGNLSVEEVAETVGISNVRTFARLFKKYEGMAPGEYRQAVK